MGQGDPPGDVTDHRRSGSENVEQVLSALPGFDGFAFDPLALVKAVNFFFGLGKIESLTALEAHCNRPAYQEQVLLVARLLFVPLDPSDVLPRLDLGLPDLAEPKDNDLFPLFPLHLLQDFPLLLVGGYLAGAEGLQPATYLEWCAQYAELRAGLLSPGSSPLATLDAFLTSKEWEQLDPAGFHAGMLRQQTLRALPQLSRPSEEEQLAMLATVEPTSYWLLQREQEAQLNLTWNPRLVAFQAS